MSSEIRPVVNPAIGLEMERTARQQARALSGGMVAIVSAAIGIFAVLVFVLLDYEMGQATHRIIKVMLGLFGVGAILVWPRIGLLLIPTITLFLPWLPKIGVKALNPQNVLVLSVFGMWALQRMAQRQPILRGGRLMLSIGVLLLLCAGSVLIHLAIPTGYPFEPGFAMMWVFRTSMTFSVYLIALSMVRGPKDRQRMTWAIVIGLLAESLVTIRNGQDGSGHRALGSFEQSNELGAFLAMFTVFTLALVPAVKKWWAKAFVLGVVAAASLACFLTVSRAAILALVPGVLLVAFRSSKVFALIVLAALLTCPFWIPDDVRQRFATTEIQVDGSDETQLEGSAQARIDTWQAMWNVIQEHPIEGVGFTGLGGVLPETGTAMGLDVKDSAHNTFLRMMAETGIFGLLAFCVLLWQCLRLSFRAARAAQNAFDRQIAIGFGAAALAMIVSCLFGDRFFSILITGNFWIAAAILDDLLHERGQA